MIKLSKILIILIAILSLFTCIDPYAPKLRNYSSLLVVDALITDANTSCTVKLSRTFQDEATASEGVTNASVYITDEIGNETVLYPLGHGKYKTDSTSFRGIIGKTYVLHVLTPSGEKYESDPCLLQPVPGIDSLYFARDQDLANNGSEMNDGIRVFLNSNPGNSNTYYRWSYEETWKFKIPFPKRFDYIDIHNIVPVKNIKEYCWKRHLSDNIIIHQALQGTNSMVKGQPVNFIASAKSDRLMSEYSILVKQYSISKNEYEFWNNLRQMNDDAGDIFAAQPFSVKSNMHNVNDPVEPVLGYFQVSAVSEKRLFIPFREVIRLQLPFYHSYSCETIIKSPADYANPYGPPFSFDELYAMFCILSDYSFIEMSYNEETHLPDKMVFAKPECANCELTGFSEKPGYWIDLK